MNKPKQNAKGVGVGRRDFLRLSLGGLTVLCFPLQGCGGEDPDAIPAGPTLPVVWIETGICTGCGSSLLDCYAPPVELLLGKLELGFHETLMGHYGAGAMEHLQAFVQAHAGRFALVVDGAVPVGAAAPMTTLGTDAQGIEYSAQELVTTVAASAAAIVALGACACFGGIPGSAPGAGVYVSLTEAIGKKVLRIPGCPPNPLWIGAVLDQLVAGVAPDLDDLGRPKAIFGKTVHELCPRLPKFEAQSFATSPGDPSKCLLKVGCKGPIARGDCPTRAWHGRSFCIKAGHPCIACTAPGFLDARPSVDGIQVGQEGSAASPFYKEQG